MRITLVISLILLCALPSQAQKRGNKKATNTDKKYSGKIDTVRVKGRSFLMLNDSSIYVQNDTILYLPDSVASKIIQEPSNTNDAFYLKMKEKFYKRRVTKELYDILFVDPPNDNSTQIKSVGKPQNDQFKESEGKRISNIYIKKLEIFGTSINDTTRDVSSWGNDVGNKVHVYTRDWIIKQNIFFDEGDIVDVQTLQDSERFLRSLPYIRDARIYTRPLPDGTVEIVIIVKDVWSLLPLFSYSSINAFDVGLIEENFLGIGHEVENEFLYNTDNSPQIGYNGIYRINNIYRTFITGELFYTSSQPLDRYGVRFFRGFITPETKYAGGLNVSKERRESQRIYPDTTIVFNTSYQFQDLWAGRSFLLKETKDGARYNLQISAKMALTNFLDRPVVESDTNQQFHDNDLYLMTIGLTKRSYEKSQLIAGFGRTEDIPQGYLAEVIVGREDNEFNRRGYLGFKFDYGRYFKRKGYIRPYVSLGSFIREGRFEQGVFNLGARYFSFLYRIRKYNIRQFFDVAYTAGINRYDNEFININGRNGIRGLDNIFLRGDKRLTFKAETVIFTPLYFLGFRFAPFVHADFALVNHKYGKLFNNKLNQGYGIGLRLRNENLAFNTFQFRFTWYPSTNPIRDLDITSSIPLNIEDYQTREPNVIGFN